MFPQSPASRHAADVASPQHLQACHLDEETKDREAAKVKAMMAETTT